MINKGSRTRDGTWTHTGLTAHWILSPACLPIPPLERHYLKKTDIGIVFSERKTAPTLRENPATLVALTN